LKDNGISVVQPQFSSEPTVRTFLLILAVGWTPLTSLSAQGPLVTLTYLGNMGVLLEGGGRKVVIDGLHRGELAEYAAVPPHLLGPLEGARTPFESLDLAFTTHRHRDHFNARSVAARLTADSSVVYLAARETVESLFARSTLTRRHLRVHGVVPPPGGGERVQAGGLSLEVLDLPHNPTPTRRVANVGILVELGGLQVLHVGDADPATASFTPHRLAGRVDVAIVPFWYLTGGDDAVRRTIGARDWIATHVPLADTAEVRRQVLARVPGAIVLTRPGERHLLKEARH
jgi:L-ascorbate metabolism protein UlaG (beta-lactamase superfamily)